MRVYALTFLTQGIAISGLGGLPSSRGLCSLSRSVYGYTWARLDAAVRAHAYRVLSGRKHNILYIH